MNMKNAVAAAPSAPLLNDKDMGLVGHVQVSLVAQLGSVQLSLDKLFKLRQGDVLEMEQALDAPVTLLLNGKPVARGELLAVDDQLGVRITELA